MIVIIAIYLRGKSMRDKLTEEEKQKLVTELNKRIHGLNCPMCHNPSFIMELC